MNYIFRSLVSLLLFAVVAHADHTGTDGREPISALSKFFNARSSNEINSSNFSAGTAQDIRVNVRVIRGVGSDEEGSSAPAVIDDRIKDLATKLQRLHFREFKLISSQDKMVPMAKKLLVAISDGETLTIRPLYVEKNRVGMWLRWQGDDGKQILDTRMHFNCGEAMLAGTDKSYGASTILAITVHP